MAVFTALRPFDFTTFDLRFYAANYWDDGLFINSNQNFNGRTYRDVLSVDARFGGQSYVINMYGTGYQTDDDGWLEVGRGTVQAIGAFGPTNDSGNNFTWRIEGISLAFGQLGAAALSNSQDDSLTLLSIMLSGNDTINLSSGADVISGFDGDDVIYSNGGADQISGGNGNDIIYGAAGTQLLFTSEGQDELHGGASSDFYIIGHIGTYTVFEGADEGRSDRYIILIPGNHTLADNVEFGNADANAGNVSITGNAGDNGLTGNDAMNVLRGLAGDDTLIGNGGSDDLFGGDGNDRLEGGADTDFLRGEGGDDILDGGEGGDFMAGGAGSDTYYVDNIDDDVIESFTDTSSDIVVFTAENRWIMPNNVEIGGLHEDAGGSDLIGTNVDSVLTGNSFDNELIGGFGDDGLTGGLGSDLLDGGDGTDVAFFDANIGNYRLSFNYLQQLEVHDRSNSGDTDTLVSIENVVFDDRTLSGVSNDFGFSRDEFLAIYLEEASLKSSVPGTIVDSAWEGVVARRNAGFSLDLELRDAEYYLLGVQSVVGDGMNPAIAGGFVPVYNALKLWAISLKMQPQNRLAGEFVLGLLQSTDGSPNAPPGGTIDTWEGIRDGYSTDWTQYIDYWERTFPRSVDSAEGGDSDAAVTEPKAETDPSLTVYVRDGLSGVETVEYEGDTVRLEHVTQPRADGGIFFDLAAGGGGQFGDALDYVYTNQAATYRLGGGNDSLASSVAESGEGVRVFGQGGSDTLVGSAADDIFYGGTGNDFLGDGGGADMLYGNAGDDTYIVESAATQIFEQAGQGTDRVEAMVSYTLAANVEELLLMTRAGDLSATGNGLANTITGNDGANTLFGLGGSDTLFGGDGGDFITGGNGNDTIDGGSNVDTAIVSGHSSRYTIRQTSTGVFEVTGLDGTDTLTGIEYLQFANKTIRLLPGTGVRVNFETANPSAYQSAMENIRDFDGNALGGDGAWLRIGSADVDGDGDIDQILVNDEIGRFATIGGTDDGLTYFDDYGWAGQTRVAGIYVDPLVESGDVVAGGPNDSQRRFQNDLQIENINRVLGADDYDGDGLQEVYFALTDGTAYLHAYMHADGNIQYANYQSREQVIEYLRANGYTRDTWAGWFSSSQEEPSDKGADQGDASETGDTALTALTPEAVFGYDPWHTAPNGDLPNTEFLLANQIEWAHMQPVESFA